jgi:phage host-nuclease inhibitor protein Gam
MADKLTLNQQIALMEWQNRVPTMMVKRQQIEIERLKLQARIDNYTNSVKDIDEAIVIAKKEFEDYKASLKLEGGE